MRHDKPASILNPGNIEPESSLPVGGDDWLSRVNLTINNFKELMKLFAQLRGNVGQGEDVEPNDRDSKLPDNPPSQAKPGLLDYIQMAINAGYGGVSIGQIIEKLSPYSLTQIMELLKNVRPKR